MYMYMCTRKCSETCIESKRESSFEAISLIEEFISDRRIKLDRVPQK